MNFLYPQFLFGLLALAIPIIIHLFNFRKTKKVYFSSNRFLKNIKESNSSKLKLKHWLVLFSRLMFIAFLVLAFAQPYFPVDSGEKLNALVKIYLDNSYSMSNETDEDLRAIDQAIENAEEIVERYPRHTAFQLLTNEFQVSSNRTLTAEGLLDRLTEVKLSPVTRSLEEVNNRLRSASDNLNHQQADVFVISDFQKSTSSNIATLSIDSMDSYYLVPLDFTSPSNLFIDSVYLANPFLLADNTNAINVIIRNTGKDAANDVVVKLNVNGSQVATSGVDINGASTVQTTFNINFDLLQTNQCIVSFEDFPVTFDNELYFSLNANKKIDILEISGEGSSNAIAQVYKNSQLFNFNRYSINNLDYNLINAVDLIVLNEVDNLDSDLTPYLQRYVDEGGTVVIVFGESPELRDFAFLRLPEPMQTANIANLSPQAIEQPDFSNPFFKNVFESSEENIAMPKASNTVTWSASGMDILKYRTGQPYISRSKRDNIYYIGSPLKDSFTNLHRQAIFVPVMYRLAALSQSLDDHLYYHISESQFTVKREEIVPQDILKLQRDEQEIIPSQFISGNRVIMEVPKYSLSPGFYDLVKEDEKVKLLAFNYDKGESKFEQFTSKDLNLLFDSQANVYDGNSLATFSERLKERNEGKELWKYFLMLALLALLVEIVLIRLL